MESPEMAMLRSRGVVLLSWIAPPGPLPLVWLRSWEPPESSSEPASTVMVAPRPGPVELLTTWPLLRETEVPLSVIAPPLPEPLFSLLSLPLIDVVPVLSTSMRPSPLAERVELLATVVLLTPATVMEPSSARSEPPLMLSSDPLRFNVPWLALMAPLEDAAPVLSTLMRPPPLAVSEEPLPTLVALEVVVAVAEGPARTPPTTMRWAGVVAGVAVGGAVAVTVVAPRTVLMPWGVAGSAEPEKI